MSQDNTYHPGDAPLDAVMMPAMEEGADMPPMPQEYLSPNDPAMRPAQRPSMSYELERLRARGRIPQDARWYNTLSAPLDRPNEMPPPPRPAGNPPGRNALGQGSALNTLMRSATRQFVPPQTLTPMPLSGPIPPTPPAGLPMRDALRQVVRSAQQGGTGLPMPPMGR